MNADELRTAFTNLPPLTPVTPWDEHRASLCKHVARHNLAKFLTWSTITTTMFVGEEPYVENELLELMTYRDYWSPALTESLIGKPPRLSYAPWTSGNAVHQAYHLKQWMDKTHLNVRDASWIVEFGGGYGAMAKIIHHLGFSGIYTLIDFPEFLLLQEYYLSSHGIDAEYVTPQASNSIFGEPDLFIALFSLSEMPTGSRLALIPPAKSYLITYQPQWGDVSNSAWFSVLCRLRQDTHWWDWQAKHVSTYRYMIGV